MSGNPNSDDDKTIPVRRDEDRTQRVPPPDDDHTIPIAEPMSESAIHRLPPDPDERTIPVDQPTPKPPHVAGHFDLGMIGEREIYAERVPPLVAAKEP